MSKVFVCISFDWEGEHFRNLHDLKFIRKEIGVDIPVNHFICPAYYFRNIKHVTERINDVVFDNDEIHLHIHAYKELIEATGIGFKTEKNYYKHKKLFGFIKPKVSGRGVPLSVYTKEEQEQIIEFSRHQLKKEFPNQKIIGFRAGGNILNDDTFEILKKLNFNFDSSATAPEIYSKGYSIENDGSKRDDYDYNVGIFTNYILKLWGGKKQTEAFLKNELFIQSHENRPIQLNSQPFQLGSIYEIPENCGMTDFVSPEKTALPTLNVLTEKSEKSGKNHYFHYGCHNEGDWFYKKQLLKFMELIKPFRDKIEFVGMNSIQSKLKS